jgi:aspartate kinase
MKVCKFGGTSLANAEQIRKVCDIVLSDPERRIMIVSAPGKRTREDIKVTDLLIALANARIMDMMARANWPRLSAALPTLPRSSSSVRRSSLP